MNASDSASIISIAQLVFDMRAVQNYSDNLISKISNIKDSLKISQSIKNFFFHFNLIFQFKFKLKKTAFIE